MSPRPLAPDAAARMRSAGELVRSLEADPRQFGRHTLPSALQRLLNALAAIDAFAPDAFPIVTRLDPLVLVAATVLAPGASHDARSDRALEWMRARPELFPAPELAVVGEAIGLLLDDREGFAVSHRTPDRIGSGLTDREIGALGPVASLRAHTADALGTLLAFPESLTTLFAAQLDVRLERATDHAGRTTLPQTPSATLQATLLEVADVCERHRWVLLDSAASFGPGRGATLARMARTACLRLAQTDRDLIWLFEYLDRLAGAN